MSKHFADNVVHQAVMMIHAVASGDHGGLTSQPAFVIVHLLDLRQDSDCGTNDAPTGDCANEATARPNAAVGASSMLQWFPLDSPHGGY